VVRILDFGSKVDSCFGSDFVDFAVAEGLEELVLGL
jgi:hypothetical protein